ncbi:hypothetical protein HNP84_005340 [Thermocatellispora tengchongensis]|uniref:Tetracycline repressor TetR C-terminal domain-containing protein n=1 Tax=Thermocatellispora tengchongensis TaxID=1073253 RepID=A0A840PAA4_9ACTN|nr:TetR/AcrR family transcriptional regulator C-terminal domain-containing protein [Thermocatellispora tengchongensis]MBB5135596.1 hypothetical protein [Thermocatellispora tengchongensis]
MADVAYGEEGHPAGARLTRRERLETVARALWRVYRRHPWLPHLTPLGRPLPLPGVAAHGEQLLTALDGLGLEPAAMLDIEILIYSYVQGLAVHLEREAQAMSATGLSEQQWLDRQLTGLNAIAASNRFPRFASLIRSLDAQGYDFDLDKLFEFGLATLLDGLALDG